MDSSPLVAGNGFDQTRILGFSSYVTFHLECLQHAPAGIHFWISDATGTVNGNPICSYNRSLYNFKEAFIFFLFVSLLKDGSTDITVAVAAQPQEDWRSSGRRVLDMPLSITPSFWKSFTRYQPTPTT